VDAEQIIIGIVLLFVFLGLIRFMTRIVVLGLIIFVGVPFALSGPVGGVDWNQIVAEAMKRGGRIIELMSTRAEYEVDLGVRVTVADGDDRCPPQTPLRLGIWNETAQDLGLVSYRLKYRPVDRSTETTFHRGKSDYIIPAGKSKGLCIERPEDAPLDAVYRGEVSDVDFMPETG
jgi:hypothetical protein